MSSACWLSKVELSDLKESSFVTGPGPNKVSQEGTMGVTEEPKGSVYWLTCGGRWRLDFHWHLVASPRSACQCCRGYVTASLCTCTSLFPSLSRSIHPSLSPSITPRCLSLSHNCGFSTCIFIKERVLACFCDNAPVLQDACSCPRGGQRLVSDGEVSQSGRSRWANIALLAHTSMRPTSPWCSWRVRHKEELCHADQHKNLINIPAMGSFCIWINVWVFKSLLWG